MLKHYIKFAYRNFKVNKIIFFGSLLTLSLGTLCIALLYSYVPDQLNMDGFHKSKDNIYLTAIKYNPQALPKVYDLNLYDFESGDYPTLKAITTIKKYKKGELRLVYDNTAFTPEGIVSDSSFFEVFDFKLQIGDKKTVLHNPNSLLLTKKMADIMFGDDNPIGKTIVVKNRQEKVYTVRGILEAPPINSSIEFDFILTDQYNDPNCYSRMGGSFIKAGKGFNLSQFDQELTDLTKKGNPRNESTVWAIPFSYKEINKTGLESMGILTRSVNEKNLYIQIIIMLVILLLSILNYSNLQVINSNARIRNAALKIVNGAGKKQIIAQIGIETVLMVLACSLITMLAYGLVLPSFISFSGIPLDWAPIKTFVTILCILSLMAGIGMVYPTIIALEIPLVKSLRNQILSQDQLKGRKAVIVFQYTLTFVLLISSIVVVRQLQLMLEKDLGFKQKNIVSAQLYAEPSRKQLKTKEDYKMFMEGFQHAKNELATNAYIKNIAQGYKPIDVFTMDWKLKGGNYEMETFSSQIVTPGYDRVFGLEMVKGRFFENGGDRSRSKKVVINEAAYNYWDIKDIKGKMIINNSWGEYELIGVVRNFDYQHLSSTVQPLMMLYMENVEDPFHVEFVEGGLSKGLANLEDFFGKNNPDETFDFSFIEEDVAKLYAKEKQLSINYILFTIVALIISAIGLFTIAIYDTRRRVREIAVRKVNGASVKEILTLLNKSFVKWVALAFLVACPLAYIMMDRWLEGFAYKTTLSWWIFIMAGMFTLLIALLTVSLQTFKAARANPVKSLRRE